MTTLYVLDVEDFRPLAQVAAGQPGVTVVKRGPYYEVTSERPFEIARNATGCRNAVWFSSIAAIRDGRVSRWDKDAICIEPLEVDAGGPSTQGSEDHLAAKERIDDLGREVT